jgi:hypothetical protein
VNGNRWLLNRTRYAPGQRGGHYESFYQRANHPERPLAFWIRYTIFAPDGNPGAAVGELWAVYFDGETGQHAVTKEVHPISACSFAREAFSVRVNNATLRPGRLTGSAVRAGSSIAWDLDYETPDEPLLLLPRRLYDRRFPKAKSLVAAPNARYTGTLTVDGQQVPVDGWVGSQNHNWGSRHTDEYAFAQVAGFDGEPDSFLEVITARSSIVGPLQTPWLTFLVLRHRGREHALTSLRAAARARAEYRPFDWTFSTGHISGRVHADASAFVGLDYPNPPGGTKHCLNTKIASTRLTVLDRATGESTTLRTSNRALFEILTDDRDHGVAIRA